MLKFPETLKYLKIPQEILTINLYQTCGLKTNTYSSQIKNNLGFIINRYKNLYNLNENYGITHLTISFSDWNIILHNDYSPPNLYKLTLMDEHSHEIKKGMLPKNLQSLKIVPGYNHSVIHLPKQLKEIDLGKLTLRGYGSRTYNQFLKNLPPSITSIKLKISPYTVIQPFKESLAKSLKTLVLNSEPLYLDGNLESLTYLDISRSHKITIDIDLLPQTLNTLKLSLSTAVKKPEAYRGFPASITNFDGLPSHLSLKFENPLNLQYLQIRNRLFSMPQNPHYNFINNFPNIKSIYNTFTVFLFGDNPKSPLPPNLKLLYLELRAFIIENSNRHIITLSNETLGSSLETLILEGSSANPTIKLPFPDSIEHIYLNTDLQSNLNEFLNSTEIKHKIRFFSGKPKLYDKLKKYYL
ncbi:hypothetical protein DICPUDRAFT_154745 [Dictyostelium purpureum]|uniref:FNIP repeat-containing protein n=1 Tax=Dictyostelium purpureum TaxID=5786 RepID=F0ZS54_DICPU|nr:uncharacterized protein DICPUDRAFT_154745 [Dictyostelium purpureum]EGC33221.1 hypothetical protein DICPUDRAFT_154745 [Dictyostelium purpureum]|eukprot:XP_003290261.1 hypothetical protein DICPUDRAFT_154745 [Dictyostelium purpureum]